MGFFKDARKSMQAGQAMHDATVQAAGGEAGMAQQYANAQAINNAQPVQDGDPLLEPISGLTFQQYVDVAYATQGMGGNNAARAKYAESVGVPAGVWEPAAQEWSNRMMANPGLNKRFNAEWQQRMRGGS